MSPGTSKKEISKKKKFALNIRIFTTELPRETNVYGLYQSVSQMLKAENQYHG